MFEFSNKQIYIATKYLISILNFPKQWVADYRDISRILTNI